MAVVDLFFGAGPWALVTSHSMGVVGFLDGFLRRRKREMLRQMPAIIGFSCGAFYDILVSVPLALIFDYS